MDRPIAQTSAVAAAEAAARGSHHGPRAPRPLADSPDRAASETFFEALTDTGFVLPTGVPGGWCRTAKFEDVLQRFDALVLRAAAPDRPEPMTFPPIVARSLIERVGYLGNFPQLAGSIHSFFGNDAAAKELARRAQAGEAWESLLEATDVMLTPAACYPVYPMLSGVLSPQGRLVTVMNWIFRHEPSHEPTRLQSFRMRELVRAAGTDEVVAWRDSWLERSLALLQRLGLPARSDVASDPFFGRAGRIMASSQRDQKLKFEILVPVLSDERPTAVCSFNWHQDHFSGVFGIRTADRQDASTACLGFGLERVTLALIKTHGTDLGAWPAAVRAALWDADVPRA